MVKATKSEIRKVLKRIKSEMIAYHESYNLPNNEKIRKIYWDKIHVIEKLFKKDPTYIKIMDKRYAADRGMYFDKINYKAGQSTHYHWQERDKRHQIDVNAQK